jgi:pyrroloquinoline quinone biosynthesis protein D
MEMLDTRRPCPIPGYQVEVLDDEVILFHPDSRTIFHSNSTGALIWQLCDGQRTVADIIQLLSAAYPDSAQQIQADVQDTLLAFAEHGAIIWP